MPAMLRYGSVVPRTPLVLAPMAGITDRQFRLVLRRIGGVGLVTMEFVSSEAIVRGNPRTRRRMLYAEEERPLSIQIYGSRPDAIAPRSAGNRWTRRAAVRRRKASPSLSPSFRVQKSNIDEHASSR